jgi:hypothetical protein
MASDRVIKVRDDLNRLINELTEDKSDQEGHILSCCLALAIEEIEKWMYHGEFTPSVAPYSLVNKDFEPSKKHDPRVDPLERLDDPDGNGLVSFTPPIPFWNSNGPVKSSAFSAAKWTPPACNQGMPASIPIYEKLRVRAEAAPIKLKTFSFLNTLAPENWDPDMMKAFRDGSRERFFNSIKMFPSSPSWLSVSEVMNYVNKMIEVYPHLWSVDNKGKA